VIEDDLEDEELLCEALIEIEWKRIVAQLACS